MMKAFDGFNQQTDWQNHSQMVIANLCKRFGENIYDSWLKFMSFSQIEGQDVKYKVHSKFMRDQIMIYYRELLQEWQKINPQIRHLTIEVDETQHPNYSNDINNNGKNNYHDIEDIGKIDSEILLDSRFTFDNFVVGKTNELAFSACLRVAEEKLSSFNPLFLYGGCGLGKTHLMHAIAWHVKKHDKKRNILYLSAEKFMHQFIRSLRDKDTFSFKDRFRSVDMLLIDDIQFICGRDATQEEFFHTFNALVDKKRTIVMSADKSPDDLEGIEERMRSRMAWGIMADIHPAGFELRLGILQSKLDKIDANIPQEVLEFLAHNINSNVRVLEGALNKLAHYAKLVDKKIYVQDAETILKDLLMNCKKRVSIEQIKKQVCTHFNIRMTDMSSERRSRNIARPRQIAMYLAKKLTPASLPDIGRHFGNRDHTTVLHAVRKIDELRIDDNALREDINILERIIG